MTAELRRTIEKIPGVHGWWKNASRDEYMDVAEEMLAAGLGEDRVAEMLTDLYWAAAACYGA